jgi:uncharacterized protein YecA (UPF0149 family)
MAERAIQLETASFLDSPRARALDVPPAELRRIVEAFLTACYEELGQAPRLLDGQELEQVVLEILPGHFEARDALAARVPLVLDAYLAHLSESAVVAHAFELRSALDRCSDAFLARVRSGAAPRRAGPRADPFVHGAPKLGRNDPCSCGSGKKFKKCHGKDA